MKEYTESRVAKNRRKIRDPDFTKRSRPRAAELVTWPMLKPADQEA